MAECETGKEKGLSVGAAGIGVSAVAGDGADPRTGERTNEDGAFTDSQRESVLVYLRGRFKGALSEADFEELAQEAWEALLAARRRGEEVPNPVGFLRKAARFDALDRLRDNPEAPFDPDHHVLATFEDAGAGPDHSVACQADLARAVEVLEGLTREQRSAYFARFVERLSTEEACERLAVPRSTYRHRLRRAIDAVQETLEPDGFREVQARLLGAYVAGVATLAERKRAERLIRNDPQSAALARELRRTHEAAAGALSPVAIDPQASAGILERISELPGRAREALAGIAGRGEEAADLATPVASAGGARGAGAAAGSGAATLLGLGGAKVAALCGGAAATVACVAAIGPVVDLTESREREAGAAPKVETARSAEVLKPAVARPSNLASAAPAPAPTPAPQAEPTPEKPEDDASGEPEPVDPAPVLSPSTPPVEREFGVASAAQPVTESAGGSGATTTQPGGAATPAQVQGEFGP